MLDLHEVGGKCLKHLRRGWNRTKGRGHKDLKRGGGKLGQGGGECLKKGGLEPAYELCITSILDISAHL